MNRPAPEVAQVRRAVRRALDEIGCPADTPILVACSGGADSTALAAAAAYLSGAAGTGSGGDALSGGGHSGGGHSGGGPGSGGPGSGGLAAKGIGRPVFGAVVDHGLQAGSADRAREASAMLEGLGIPTRVLTVQVSGPGGLEAAARRARYEALRAARPSPESPILLGHTLDDQAETVLLGLGRGSGARSMAGMASYDDPWLRPLLDVRRASTRAACVEQGLAVWDDPHNDDPRFTRVRLRHEVLPLLEDVLAGGVAGALARTAAQLAEDLAALDEMAAEARSAVELRSDDGARSPDAPRRAVDGPPPAADAPRQGATAGCTELDAQGLAGYPAAVRRRVLRSWLMWAGVRDLSDARLRTADDLVGRWRGQGGLALQGGRELGRENGRLVLRRSHAHRTDSAHRSDSAHRTDSGNPHDLT